MKQFCIQMLYKYLAFFARRYVARHNPVTIGITGTVGKTTSRMIIYEMLKKYMEPQEIVYTSPKNFNSELGIILSLFQIESYTPGGKHILPLIIKIMFLGLFGKKAYDVIVLEYGIDHPGDMEFLVSVVQPDISVFTKLDYTHVEYFENKEQIGHEKFKLMYATKVTTFLNSQDDFCQSEGKHLTIDVEPYFRPRDITGYKIQKDDTHNVVARFKAGKYDISSNIIGKTNAQYISLGLRILKEIGWAPKEEHIDLEFQNQAGRWTFLKGKNNSILIDSSYNAGPESMQQAIADTVYLQKKLFPKYRIGFILGDMRELGKSSSKQHKIVFRAAIQHADFILSIGVETKKYFSAAAKKNEYHGVLKHFLSAKKAGEYAQKLIQKKPTILLIKGSQNTIFSEEAIPALLENPDDVSLLCRQEPYWQKAKQYFFGT